jgi:hypothetical protein
MTDRMRFRRPVVVDCLQSIQLAGLTTRYHCRPARMVRLIKLWIKPDQGVLRGLLQGVFQATGDGRAARLEDPRLGDGLLGNADHVVFRCLSAGLHGPLALLPLRGLRRTTRIEHRLGRHMAEPCVERRPVFVRDQDVNTWIGFRQRGDVALNRLKV